MSVYYNDSDPFVCAWLRNLIAAKLLPAGDVDERPIEQVQASDVARYSQCHFFAGIGGWPYALQLAGWGDRPVWTGSCPCQPFSAAGTRKSHADARHLWPAWFNLIRQCHPVTVFGEQVSGAAGLGWLDAVALDLETLDYAVGACVLGAHSVGAPHIRQRLWFVADAADANGRSGERREETGTRSSEQWRPGSSGGDAVGLMANTECDGRRSRGAEREGQQGGIAPNGSGAASELGHAQSERWPPGELSQPDVERNGLQPSHRSTWDACDWLPCRDGEARPVEPGTFPLAHGIPQRVGRLRAYGNAINPYTAAAFVRAYLECQP